MNKDIKTACDKFEKILNAQLSRLEELKKGAEWENYSKLRVLRIGICYGDGIGVQISRHAEAVLRAVLSGQDLPWKAEFVPINGLTIENRIKAGKAIPDKVLKEIKSCNVILKGPTTTPQEGDGMPNLESANVAMRRELDLFANIRPIRIPAEDINWTFFRENTEGEYILGSKGFDVTPELSVDFKVATQQGCERIIKMAFEYARKNNLKKVTVVTKANVIKTTDGRFLKTAKKISAEYRHEGIACDEWYVDIMSAKLLDRQRRKEFQVIVLPNLYGDILTDEAAQLQGGVGTAGSANVGKKYAMFEAIHGSAPRMVKEGRAKYADPSSMIRACAMLLKHVGLKELSELLDMALDVCAMYEKKFVITGRENGVTGEAFGRYVIDTAKRKDLKETWQASLKKNRTE